MDSMVVVVARVIGDEGAVDKQHLHDQQAHQRAWTTAQWHEQVQTDDSWARAHGRACRMDLSCCRGPQGLPQPMTAQAMAIAEASKCRG